MGRLKKLLIFVLLTAFVFIFAACGGDNESNVPTTAGTTAETVPVSETEVQTAPAADTKVSSDIFIGSWKDIESAESFVNITQTDSGFLYEDNDGKYNATFQDGVLKVQVTETEGDTADAYINPESGHLLLSYQGSLTEYEKK